MVDFHHHIKNMSVKEEIWYEGVTDEEHGDSKMQDKSIIDKLKFENDIDEYEIDVARRRISSDICPVSCGPVKQETCYEAISEAEHGVSEFPAPIQLRVYGVKETKCKIEPPDDEPPTIEDDPLKTEDSVDQEHFDVTITEVKVEPQDTDILEDSVDQEHFDVTITEVKAEPQDTDMLEKEIRKKRNAEYQKKYRERQKNKNETSTENIRRANLRQEKHRKRRRDNENIDKIFKMKDALRKKEYRHKLKCSRLNAILIQKEGNVSQIFRGNTPISSFGAPYEQHPECATPHVLLRQNMDILGDGNCFFHSVIKIMQLQISPKDIRKQLLNSAHLHTCPEPSTAKSILSSDIEFADYNCLFIFSREYHLNICVHFNYFNFKTKKEDVLFCHYKVNKRQNFIHLHLVNQHFTPYIETDLINSSNDSQQLQDLETSSHEENNEVDEILNSTAINYECPMELDEVTFPTYTNYYQHSSGHLDFYNHFKNNIFGYSCAVCDRLWWKNDLKKTSDQHDDILQLIIPNYISGSSVDVCATCLSSLDRQKIPFLSVYNGFSYPVIPSHLPKLNLIEQRLISPRIPFMQIRRLRHVNGQYGIYGQIINVPTEVDTMVNQLPRNITDDHCFYVHIKNKEKYRTSYVHGLISKKNIKEWLAYLVQTPLYIHHDIEIDNTFLNNDEVATELVMDDISEHVPIEDSITAQQQTLMWNEDRFLYIAPGEKSVPLSILFDEYAEELSFPTIYGGQFRTYRDEINVTTFMQATSELRRTDRRGVDPQHLLYLAAKIMRQRISKSISVAFKHIGYNNKITKEDIQSENYINNCIESNLAFLRYIPNSAWYWSERKRDLFAMIRQLGTPTAFMTLSANESGWEDLLKLLYIFKNNGANVSDEFISEMSFIHKATLISEDAVSCAIYFDKLVNCLLKILQSKKRSPFGKYRVVHYFKRIEFQHRGSPHAHILLWLDNAPENLLNNNPDVIQMIDELVSVAETESSGNIKLLTHKHTLTCYKKMDPNKKDNCRFGAPFMPTKNTVTLLPMKDTDSDYSEDLFKKYKEHYKLIRSNLENINYTGFDHFYTHNNIESDEHYYNIIRAGIKRPKLFYRRKPSEKWFNSFNPFVFHHLKSNMDFQIIQDEYACAAYVVEYVNKHNRGISNLQRHINEIMDENPEFDIIDITKKMSIDILHSVEMSAQEAAWYLLRQPMAKSSIVAAYIPTICPTERQGIKKTMNELDELNDDCTDIWKENWFDKYEKRPDDLSDVTLAQFIANYYINNKKVYVKRDVPNVIRYRSYDITDNFNDYRREMVLLHIPFRNENDDVLTENKFIQIYEEHQDLILQRRREFESNLDIHKTLEICRELCRERDED